MGTISRGAPNAVFAGLDTGYISGMLKAIQCIRHAPTFEDPGTATAQDDIEGATAADLMHIGSRENENGEERRSSRIEYGREMRGIIDPASIVAAVFGAHVSAGRQWGAS